MTSDTPDKTCNTLPDPAPAMLYHVYTAENDGRVFLWNSWLDEDKANEAAQGVRGIVTAVAIVSDYWTE